MRSILSSVVVMTSGRGWGQTVSGIAALTILLTSTACGSGGDDSESAGSGTPTVVATTSIWADITRHVACDGQANVVTVIPLAGDPHSFEASLRDRETMENAVLIVSNGLRLEESLADTIDAVEKSGTPVVRVAEGLDTIGSSTAVDQSGNDPHVWFDPTRVTNSLAVIADALASVGFDRGALDKCVDAYSTELADLDEEVAGLVAELSDSERLLVTNHDSLAYFADRYNFQILGSVIPSPSTLAQTNAAELQELADRIAAAGVSAIFVETQHSSSDAEALADRVGDIEVVTLLTGTLDEPGTVGASYIGWLLQNTRWIVDGLS